MQAAHNLAWQTHKLLGQMVPPAHMGRGLMVWLGAFPKLVVFSWRRRVSWIARLPNPFRQAQSRQSALKLLSIEA